MLESQQIFQEFKKDGMVIFVSEKVDFKAKSIVKDKGHFIMIKESYHQKDTTILKFMYLIIEFQNIRSKI